MSLLLFLRKPLNPFRQRKKSNCPTSVLEAQPASTHKHSLLQSELQRINLQNDTFHRVNRVTGEKCSLQNHLELSEVRILSAERWCSWHTVHTSFDVKSFLKSAFQKLSESWERKEKKSGFQKQMKPSFCCLIHSIYRWKHWVFIRCGRGQLHCVSGRLILCKPCNITWKSLLYFRCISIYSILDQT